LKTALNGMSVGSLWNSFYSQQSQPWLWWGVGSRSSRLLK